MRTDMTKLAVAFRNFANTSKNVQNYNFLYLRTFGQEQSLCTANEIRHLLFFFEGRVVILNVGSTVQSISTVYSLLIVSLDKIVIFCRRH